MISNPEKGSKDIEKTIDHIIQENRFLSFQIDQLSLQISKEIDKKYSSDKDDEETKSLIEEIKNIQNEIDLYETEKQNFLSQSANQNEKKTEIKYLKKEIKRLQKENEELRKNSSLSELFEELSLLKEKEFSLKESLKNQKISIKRYAKNSDFEEESFNHLYSLTPDLKSKVDKFNLLKIERIKSTKAWQIILSEARFKNKELEHEVSGLKEELRAKNRSCRLKKIESRRRKLS